MELFLLPDDYLQEPEDCFVTATGNKISRASVLKDAKRIRVQGHSAVLPGAMIRGDLADVVIGEWVLIGAKTTLQPCSKVIGGVEKHFPMNIGSYVTIGSNCTVSSAVIGSYVRIGNNCTLSNRCIIKSCVVIEDDTVVPGDMVIPPLSLVSGCPAKIVGNLDDATQERLTMHATQEYHSFAVKKS